MKRAKRPPAKRRRKSAKPVGIRLDLGCGRVPKEGFVGVDIRRFTPEVVVADLRKPWPWKSESVSEVFSSHFLEHLDGLERVHFCNELWRVLEWGAQATIVVPYFGSARAYGDPTHKWPPFGEWWPLYLNKEWRDSNAPHDDVLYECDFDHTYGYNLHPSLVVRPTEHQQFAVVHYKEGAQDFIISLVKNKRAPKE